MRTHGSFGRGNLPDFAIARFKELAEKAVRTDKGCLIWPLSPTPQKYGSFTIGGETYGAHRVAYVLAADQIIPAGKLVCHRCDTPACIEGDHLFVGTDADNAQDKARKGRVRTGEARMHAPPGMDLVPIHTRLFRSDVEAMKRIAAERGVPWQIELRLLVRRALKGEIREVVMLKEK